MSGTSGEKAIISYKTSRAGSAVYSSLIASTLSAFPATTRIVILDNPSATLNSLPLLPSNLTSNISRKRKSDGFNESSRGGGASVGVQTYTVEPRRISLERIMNYFCDTVGIISDEGGVENLTWYELALRKTARAPAPEAASEWRDIDIRFAVHKMPDETGYSGRERLSVRLG